MTKKGQIEAIFGILGILITGLVIVAGSMAIAEENRYVGDSSTKLIYDSKICDVEVLINQENRIYFDSLTEAYDKRYSHHPDCS